MGLDIFVHRVKQTELVSNNYEEIYDTVNENGKKLYSKQVDKLVSALKKAREIADEENNPTIYFEEYHAFVDKLSKVAPYKEYPFKLGKFKKPYIPTIKEVEDMINEEKKHYFKIHDAYFRKVNFIYEFFEEDINHDNEMALVDANAIRVLIDVCNEVLKHHKIDNDKGIDYAQTNLPTRSGFFFGSTDYDDWYWHDVKDCLSQMKKVYYSLKEGDKVLISFSW